VIRLERKVDEDAKEQSLREMQDLLLDAWPAVRDVVPTARLALIGDGPQSEALARRAVEGVDFMGSRDDVGDWLAACNVVAVPSRYDCPSLAVLEGRGWRREAMLEIPHGPCCSFATPGGHRLALYQLTRPEVAGHFEGRRDF